jgi:hypothetical protein
VTIPGCDAGRREYQGCEVDTQCACHLNCFMDPGFDGLSVCEAPCFRETDCVDVLSKCEFNSCVLNFCVGDFQGHPVAGAYAQPCDAWDAGSGTCVPVAAATGQIAQGFCIQGGSATEGGDCLPWWSFDGGGVIFPTPDPSTQATLMCGVGDFCVDLQDAGMGVCAPLGDGGCVEGLASVIGVNRTEFAPCWSSVQCECPQACVTDPLLGTACATPCSADSNCPLAFEACSNDAGFCSFHECGVNDQGHPIEGVLNGNCGPGDAGVCFAQVTNGGQVFGVCIRTGDAGAHAPCDPDFRLNDPSLMCSGGLVCLAFALNGAGLCMPLCDPTSDAGCSGANEVCTNYTGQAAPHVGFCCLPTGSTCTSTEGCCNGCDTSGSCI